MTEDRAALEAAWARTDELFGMLRPDRLLERPIPLRHPFLFYLGHLPAFAWNHIGREVLGQEQADPELDVLFARGIDPDDEASAAAEGRSSWPATDRVRAYRDRIRAKILELLPALERQSDPYAHQVVPLVLEHEWMHHETLLYMIARERPDCLTAPDHWSVPTLSSDAPPVVQVAVESGVVTLGADRTDLRFGWCNEFPSETVHVESFELDDRPVTVGDWAVFVRSGGYRNPKLWTDEDWGWRRRQGIEWPDAWRQRDAGFEVRSLFAWHSLEDVRGWPVYVSLAEARAWCRWAGRRLPTESELHRAAFTTPAGEFAPAVHGTGVDFRSHAPCPVAAAAPGPRGVRDLIGNGWEWTSTPFLAREGFRPHLRSYPEYSQDFFDGHHFVVFGGSWSTHAALLRRSFRNWYQHHYPYAWVTFRTAAR
jgi:ergothioneine biosynthesis protein EgtB